MKVVIVGGGPAGLYLAVLLRVVDPSGQVIVLERRRPEESGECGIMFQEDALARLNAADPATYDRLAQHFERWSHIDVHVHGRTIRSSGHHLAGISRRALIQLLADRADALGAEIHYGHEVQSDPASIGALKASGADLIVAADGAQSTIRESFASHFVPHLDERAPYYCCFETARRVDATTFAFVQNDDGIFQAHAYPYDEHRSAFVVHCDPQSWRAAGFDQLDATAATRTCERLFASWLDGASLSPMDGEPETPHPWRHFVRVTNDRWQHDGVVLLGNAAHTTHFATALGTRLALEDALGLVLALAEGGVDDETLAIYEAERKTEALRVQTAAANAMDWFEHVSRYIHLPTEQFAYSLVVQTQGVGHETLRARDRVFIERVERRIAGRREMPVDGVPVADVVSRPAPPPMFTPFQLRGMTLPNRVVVAPMDLYSADDGAPNDFHVVHFGARALGGAGLLITEMACVSADARISLGSAGMYRPDHVAAWLRVTDAIHRWSPAKIALQLGHAGAKGATRRLWEGIDEPLPDGWETIAPSAVAFRPRMQVPRAMTRADMDRVRDDFVRATRMAIEAEFDMIELQCAHGHLLSAFITPLQNHRDDEYGGSLANRLRYPLEVFAAVREAWPANCPISVCIAASDWVDGGIDAADGVAIAAAFRDAGADIVHVAAGHTAPNAHPVYGRMFQTPLSDRVRNEAGIPTIAVGNITDADQVNAIITSGRADLCALGRPHLANPNWTLHAAAAPAYPEQWWPPQYERGRRQLQRELEHRVDMLEANTV